jgi:hypothetical protein
MSFRIRDWEKHFERDRSKQWKVLQWVPIPNKQGKGYRKIMKEKNGLEIFACWIAIIELASKCEVRGDLSKYSIDDISLLTLIDENKLKSAIKYLSEVLDWIEVIKESSENLDIDVNKNDKHGMSNTFDSSILSNSILFNSIQDRGCGGKELPNPEFVECAELLRKRILEFRQQKIIESTIKAWCNDVRLMIKMDGRTSEQIKLLINECHDMQPSPTGFTWRNNILSMGTLREKWNEGKIFIGMTKKPEKKRLTGKDLIIDD